MLAAGRSAEDHRAPAGAPGGVELKRRHMPQERHVACLPAGPHEATRFM